MNARPVAVVTGGSRRLGRQLCEVLAARGFDLVIGYRTAADEAAALARQLTTGDGRAREVRVDVALEAQVAAAFEEVKRVEGRVDLLVNNVGNYDPRPITQLDPRGWDATLASNLSGAWYCCYHALQLMGPGGHIINIGTAGLEGTRANVLAADYYVSKTGLLSLTRSLAAGHVGRQIRVNMVSPGQLENSVDLPPTDQLPMGRPGTLADVARAVEYLLEATYVTGANLEVAGGYLL